MNKEIKAKWVSALRSGDYVQGKGQLRRGNKFCCLGVLCNIHAQEHPESTWLEHRDTYLGEIGLLPNEVTKWIGGGCGITGRVSIGGDYQSLVSHNDAGRTFLEIADAIESQL